jgi:hypothetical protein
MLHPSQHPRRAHNPETSVILATQEGACQVSLSKTSQQPSQVNPVSARRKSVRYVTNTASIHTRPRALRTVSRTRKYEPHLPILQLPVSIGTRREHKCRAQYPTMEQNTEIIWTTGYNETRCLYCSTRSHRGNLSSSQETIPKDPKNGHQARLGLGITDASSTSNTASSRSMSQYSAQKDDSRNFVRWFEDRLWRCNSSGNVAERWSLEIISWVISVVCMIIVVTMLLYMKDKRIPGWPTTLTLTVFFKIASAALLLPTSEAIGQLKWSWIKGDSRMWDFEIFDLASRGPWGSILLLFRTKCMCVPPLISSNSWQLKF